VTVEPGADRWPATAVLTEGDDRRRRFDLLASTPPMVEYADRVRDVSREIPIFRLVRSRPHQAWVPTICRSPPAGGSRSILGARNARRRRRRDADRVDAGQEPEAVDQAGVVVGCDGAHADVLVEETPRHDLGGVLGALLVPASGLVPVLEGAAGDERRSVGVGEVLMDPRVTELVERHPSAEELDRVIVESTGGPRVSVPFR
jgi:hypothetical protein